MKAYFKGLGMDSVIDIADKRPDYFVSIPKEMQLLGIMEAKDVPCRTDFKTAKFTYIGMMPVYELTSII